MHCSWWLSPCIDPPFAKVIVNSTPISDGKVQVLNGTVSTFQCQACGSPPVVASWSTSVESINRDLLGGNDMVLKLTQDDEGIYTCIVNNTHENLSHPYHVEVQVYGECPAHTSEIVLFLCTTCIETCYLCNEWNVHA